jgi:aspartate/methionine/tyrosine aminotransferase
MPIEIESPEQLGYGRIRCNLAESSVSDASLGDLGVDLDGLVLQYGDHLGLPDLRAAIAADAPGLGADDVLITPGAAAALFMVATSLLAAGDHVVVARPNYATNIETPRAIGADVAYLDLAYGEGYRVDPARIEALMTPRTRLVSLTSPHNPTGSVIDEATLREVVALVERRGCLLLFDETYREMTFGPALPVAASLSPRAISVSSLSKTYGLPGIRIGWLVTQDVDLRDRFLAAKEQILISGSVVDETIALAALRRRPSWLPRIRERIAEAFEATRDWMTGHPMLEWIQPAGGVVGFPRVRPELPVDVDAFYRILFEEHGTIVGPGHWFEQPRSHFRLGYGWPDDAQLRAGLASIDLALDASLPGDGARTGRLTTAASRASAAVGNALVGIDGQIFRTQPPANELVVAGDETIGLTGDGTPTIRLPVRD